MLESAREALMGIVARARIPPRIYADAGEVFH